MKRKITVLVLALYVFSFCPGASALGDDLIINGGFEDVSSSKPANLTWRSSDSSWSANTVVQSAITHEGSRYAVKIIAPEDGNAYIYQRVSVLPETDYTLSFWIYGINITSADMTRVKFEFYKDLGNDKRDPLGKDLTVKFAVTNGSWNKLTYTFTTPQNCDGVSILPRMFSGGAVYIDDISLHQVSEPRFISLSTDGVFYYSDLTSGEATVRLNPYYSNYSGLRVDFALKDGESVLEQRQGISFTDGYVVYNIPLMKLEIPKKEYTIEAKIKNNAGAVLQTETQAVYKYPRPLTLGRDGLYRTKNKDTGAYDQLFYPSFGYHVPQTMYADAKAAGINVVQLSYWYADYEADPKRIIQALDYCSARGVMALVTLYRDMKPAGDVANIENTKLVVQAAMGHPAVFAWAVMDEPFHQVDNAEQVLSASYKVIRDIDDIHPVYIVDNTPAQFIAQGKYVDIMAIDPYPRGINNSAAYVAEQTELARAAVNYDKPVYVLLQAFLYGDTDKDGKDDYFPTFDEVRHMWYQSLMAGAKAVGYYAFSDCYGSIPMSQTALWDGVTGFANSEMRFSYDFFLDSEKILMSEYKDENLWVKRWEKNGETYIAVLNSKTTENTVSVDTGGGRIEEVLIGSADGLVSASGSLLTLRLKGSGVNIYKLKTDGVIFSKNGIVQKSFERGSYTVEGTVEGNNGNPVRVYASLYIEEEGIRDIAYFYELSSGAIEDNKFDFNCELNIPDSRVNLLKIFVFNHSLKPYIEAFSLSKM